MWITAVTLFAAAVRAESAAPARGAALADEIPEVVVTAQKREQRSQDIPISVSALSAQEIERLGAHRFNDVLLSIPGVSYSATQPGLSRYAIRGISTAASSPTVGLYLDDISLLTIGNSFSGAADLMLADLDRVEVLKGPQGTLYGGSAMGGAIKYVSRKPALDRFSVTAAGEVGSVERGGVSYGGESFVDMPLIDDRLAVRVGSAYRLDAGYIDNIPAGEVQVWARSATLPPAAFAPVTYSSRSAFTREDDNERRTFMARMSVMYVPDDSLTIAPVATIQRLDQPNPDEFFTNLPGLENTARFKQPTRDDLNVFSLDVTKRLARVSVTSLTGYVDRDIRLDRDFSLFIGYLVPDLLANNSFNITTTHSRTFTQELRLASADAKSRLQWIAGLYYSSQRDGFHQTIDTAGSGDFFGNGTDNTFTGVQLTDTFQKAAFGDLTYTFRQRWDFGVGLRWFDIEQKINGVFDGVFNGGHSQVDDKRSTDVGVTRRFSLAYRPRDNHLLYGSASEGFRPGGPNRFSIQSPLCDADLQHLGLTRAPESFEPDRLWTYELGSKNELDDRRALLNVAIFYTDWKKIQQQVTLTSCAFPFVANVGAAVVKGAELSAESAPAPGVKVGANVSYTATRITQTAVGVPAQVGQRLLDTPLWMGNLFGEYRLFRTLRWTATFRGEYQYHGANLRQFETLTSVTYPDGTVGALPDDTRVQAAYHVVNASLRLEQGSTHYRLFVNNASNATPYLDFRRAPGFSAATTLMPRTVGVSVGTAF